MRYPRSSGLLAKTLDAAERNLLCEALKLHDGNISETAPYLGISRRALTAKMRFHDLQKVASYRREAAAVPGPRS